MRYGVNYVPSKEWFYGWQDLDLTSVGEDLAAIGEIGFDHIRMHLRWDLFQPNASLVSDGLLEKLRAVLDLAHRNGLQVCVTALNGWMSGFWFLPSFLKGRHIITDKSVVEAEYYYFSRLAEATADHPALLGIDVGNEINMYAPTRQSFSSAAGDKWLTDILAHIETLFPSRQNVVGVDHQPWFADAHFSRKTLANTGAMTSLHAWAGFTGATEYGGLSDECLSLAEYNIELANAYAQNARRPVWIQEYGMTNEWMADDEFETYVRACMTRAARSDNLWGFTWWCSHDLDRKYRDFEPLEYDLGVLTTANKLKPLGRYVKDCIRDIKNGFSAPALQTGVAVVIDEDLPFMGWKYGEAFARLLRDGIHAKFVLSSKIADNEYLTSRGINACVDVGRR